MRARWARLGLRGRLTLSFGAIVVVAFGVVFVTVRAQMSHEATVIHQEEAREAQEPGAPPGASTTTRRLADRGRPVRRREDLPPGRRGGPGRRRCSPATWWRRGRRRRCAASPPPPPRSTPATSARGSPIDPAAAAELRTLADSFNHMLDRLEDAFARQRGFVSDASHELRSPLTAIRGQIEVLAREPDPTPPTCAGSRRRRWPSWRRVERLVEELLALARLDEGAGPARRELDAAGLPARGGRGGARRRRARSVAAAARIDADPEHDRPRDPQPGRERPPPRRAGGDGDGLLDRGRRTPAGRRRRRRAGHRAGRARARLRPLPPQRRGARPRLGRRRASGWRSRAAIVEAHGGTIRAEDSPLGGARVSFELPGLRPAR